MLSALLGSVAPIAGSLISGMFNQSGASANAAAQQAINAQNLQFAQKQASGQFLGQYYSNLVSAAGSAGLSPLALLGGNPTSGPSANIVAPQPGAGSLQTGQDVSRAAIAVGDQMTKMAELDLAAKRLQVAGMENDVVAGQMRNSVQARAIASVGSPPTSSLVPLPQADPRFDPEVHPMMQRVRGTAGITVIPSAQTQQGLWSPIPGMPANPAVGLDIARQNLANDPTLVRPDIGRQLLSLGNYLRGVPDYFLGN